MLLSSRTRSVLFSLACLPLLAGCGDEADPDDPTILGTPPRAATLGVEYEFNIGAFGGDDALDFSLVNAPAWMALEDVENNARPGVIVRGVPGITGGRQGEADLGTYENIQIVANDGRELGANGFTVEVQHNGLSVEQMDIAEGEAFSPDVNEDSDAVCELPKTTRELPEGAPEDAEPQPLTSRFIAEAVPVFDEASGDFIREDRELTTIPVVIPVSLDQPSVEPVVVAWEIRSRLDREQCIDGDPKSCELSETFRRTAAIGLDVIAASGEAGMPALETPDYLTYDPENMQTGGTLRFEPGKTTCFIRLEVVDDSRPELPKGFTLELTEVREGIASLELGNATDSAGIVIEDNEPTISFEPLEFIITEGESREVTARLSQPNTTDRPLKALVNNILTLDSGGTARRSDYDLQAGDEPPQDQSLVIEFPPGKSETTFRIIAEENTSDPLGAGPPIEDSGLNEDDLLVLNVDPEEQFGRDDFVQGSGTDPIRARINEWRESPDLGAISQDFVPTAMDTGIFGELYLAGVSGDTLPAEPGNVTERAPAEGNSLLVRRIDRLGRLDADNLFVQTPQNAGERVWQPDLSVVFRERSERGQVFREQGFLIAATSNGQFPGLTPKGGRDVIATSLFDNEATDSTPPAQQWQLQLGQGSDDDLAWARAVSLSSTGLGINTRGPWEESDDTFSGGIDTAFVRLGSLQGDGVVEVVRLAGSSGDDRMVAGGISTGALVGAGSTNGAFGEDGLRGGWDILRGGVRPSSDARVTLQDGTTENDFITDAVIQGNSTTLVGSQFFDYGFEEGAELTVNTESGDRRRGFILRAQSLGPLQLFFSLDREESSGDERLFAVDTQGSLVVTGGQTDGVFEEGASPDGTSDAIVAGIDFTQNNPRELWRRQISDAKNLRVIDVVIADSDKIFVLLEAIDPMTQARSYRIALFDSEGNRLDI